MANHVLKIWQIPTDHPHFRDLAFASWQQTVRDFGREDMPRNSYRMVWSEKLGSYPDLDEIYERFNINHPEGYAGRSLSISDLVEVDGDLFFCHEYRWRQVRWEEDPDE